MVGFWATDKGADPELRDYFKNDWGPMVSKLGITMRGIVPDDESLKDYRAADATLAAL